MSLHTRSLKYGKLQGGVLVEVAPSLMRRLKQHFHRFDFGVKVIFGMSGFVWVSHISEGDMAESDELNDVSQALHGSKSTLTLTLTLPLTLNPAPNPNPNPNQALHGSGGDGAADKADPSQGEPDSLTLTLTKP